MPSLPLRMFVRSIFRFFEYLMFRKDKILTYRYSGRAAYKLQQICGFGGGVVVIGGLISKTRERSCGAWNCACVCAQAFNLTLLGALTAGL